MTKKYNDPDFIKYKKEMFDFNRTNDSYSERIGKPDELSSVIGLISMGFQRLEDVLSAFIIEMLGVEIPKGKIIISELSFTNKINMFSSLFHLLKSDRHFNYGKFDKDQYFNEMVRALSTCQEFRNQVMHSSFIQGIKTNFKIIRHKLSAKAKRGLTEIESEVDIPFLFDIYDYIISISMIVEEFFIDFNPNRKEAENIYHSTELTDIFKYRT